MPTRGWLGNLSAVWQSALVLAGAVSFGAMVAFALAGWIHLPEQVEAQGDALQVLQEDVYALKRDIPRMRCILEAIALREDPIRKCGL